MKSKFYDDIARNYDSLVDDDCQNNHFPYAEHETLHQIIAEYISDNEEKEKLKILDLGIGTGSLYEKIIPERMELTGIDNCEDMLEIARLRLADANLINHDLVKGLPEEISSEYYDYIVITYTFMHFSMDYVIQMINLLKDKLAPFGRIFIGDIIFLDAVKKLKYTNRYKENVISGINYHLYEPIAKKVDDSLSMSFMEINEYTGLIIAEKLYESSLHYEETLVKYKTNTVKWKSSHPQKKSE